MGAESSTRLDEIDKKIIDALQANARLSYAALGRLVGLSAAVATKRLKRMEELGVISGYRVDLGPEAFGLPILAFIWMPCERVKHRAFLKAVKGFDNIVECHQIAGSNAFILKGLAHSVKELEGLVEKLLDFGVPNVSVVFSSPVAQRSLPVAN